MSYDTQDQVHAPYHFVPLSKWVYMPDWAHLVSHDHPFQEGGSGAIEYTLNNKTPLCVGAEQEKDAQGISVVKWARDPSGKPVIPGSSLKGMVRSVLEIASFGKFNAIDDSHFSFRDISSKSHYLTKVIEENDVQAGWIKYNKTNKVWEFTEADFCKLSHEALNQALKKNIRNSDTAIEKYEQVKLSNEYKANISLPRGKQGKRWADDFNQGTTIGYCVFTNERIKGQGKASDYEFSYFFYNKRSVKSSNVDAQVQHLFANHRSMTCEIRGKETDQVQYLQENEHPVHGIPVFALKKGSEVHSIGFARMPRVSYKNGTKDLADNQNKAHSADAYFDMAELMFGTLREKALSIKSRVMFSDATLDSCEHNLTSAPVILSSPKATFLGGYIQQHDPESYSDYNNDNSVLSGWKRYPIKRDFKENDSQEVKSNKVKSKLELLEAGSKFSGKIFFHNLKQEELSALLWALTLGGSSFNCHSLGHGKPLGAGAVQFSITDDNIKVKGASTAKVSAYIDTFESHMEKVHYKVNGWKGSVQINHLLELSDTSISDVNNFEYMKLKDFQEVKNSKSSLAINDHNDKSLNDIESKYEPIGAPSFGKGRLKQLFDSENTWHKSENKLKEKAHISNSDMSVYDKSKLFLEFIASDQDKLNGTEKKNKINELRNILKDIKALVLTTEEAEHLLSIYKNIKLSEKDVKKAIKYLEGQW
ncbi:TIGR03986 family CRISPR-associated RAMP protein [uncultured Psychromonas sp.]|uniref:TIGR03986 family type III CRISPR-associated RAMP protein n=1 Tax=uncultured Psychromonas sp. TaxID=173974 RepID=UPI00262C1348|nr:TIGR03986 family CRISPR-associated RAMP protein [uncultured Psychromonas sp.]